MNSTHDHDFSQFRSAFDASIDPEQSFNDQLMRKLAAAQPLQRPTTTVLASPSRSDAPLPKRRNHPLMLIASVLLVVSISFASIWVLSGKVLQGEHAGAPEVTLPANAAGTPGPDVALSPEKVDLGIEHDLVGISGVADDAVIVSAMKDGKYQTTSVGPDSVDAWSPTTVEYWDSNGDGKLRVSFNVAEIQQTQDDANQRPVVSVQLSLKVFDTETGEILWSKTLAPIVDQSALFPIATVIDDEVVVTATAQSATGYDARSGDVLWEFVFEEDPQSMAVDPGQPVNGLMSTDNDELVFVLTGGRLVTVDHETGTITSDVQIEMQAAHEWIMPMEASQTEQGMVVIWMTSYDPEQSTVVTLMDPATGSVKSEVVVDRLSTSSRVSSGGTVVVTTVSSEPTPWYLHLLGRQGDSSVSMTWIDVTNGTVLLTTSQTKFDPNRAPISTANDGYACNVADSFSCYDRAGTKYVVTDEVVHQAEIVGDTLYYTTDDGLYRVTLP